MAVAAEATTTLRVGRRVFCQDYRHPAVLAKEAATLDLPSEGRLEADIVSFNFNNRAGCSDPTACARRRPPGRNASSPGCARPPAPASRRSSSRSAPTSPSSARAAGPPPTGWAARWVLTRDEMLDHPHALLGEVEEICDRLRARRERFGIHYVTVPDTALTAFAPVVAKLAGG
jgi:alkanesulfonate monooxygenase SsuD/methylene tetrahydromethanopterin reductase-like flavin-dependent oxidoreductase (luciferase family)